MIAHRTLVSSLIGTLWLLSVATASPAATGSPAKSDYTEPSNSDLKNFPVNALPPLTYSSKQYTFYFDGVSFFDAWDKCRRMGKRLASIESYQDYVAYRDAVLPYANYEVTFWIAATNMGAKSDELSKFYWITNDRPVGYVSGFQNWLLGFAPEEPDMCVATYLGSASWIYGTCANSISAYSCEESQDV